MNVFLRLLPVLLMAPAVAHAQVPSGLVPGSADAARVDATRNEVLQSFGAGSPAIAAPDVLQGAAPEGAEDIRFVLEGVRVDGATAFTEEELSKIYAADISREISLDKIWGFAARITQLYRQNGYFLSRAYVPAQDIEGGTIVINVVEGYIGDIVMKDEKGQSYVTDMVKNELLSEKPIKIETVESYLLRLNDLPGAEYRAVLSTPQSEGPEGAVDMILMPEQESDTALIRLDNHASRFLGPHQIYAYYETSFLPLHKTSLSLLGSLPADELKNAGISHKISLTPELTLELAGSVTHAQPGFTLKPLDLKSRSVSWETALSYNHIRRRNENLNMRLSLGGRNTSSDLAGAIYTRDRVVAARMALTYDLLDSWSGQNILSATLSRGIDGLGASEEGEAFLSRAEAKPDFTKLELSATRAQALPGSLVLRGSVGGQLSSGALYSSEEYGYGGQTYGRAYDSSELTGDEGVSTSVELQYSAWANMAPVGISPFVYYDIGKVWNDDAGQIKKESASSAGMGMRFEAPYQVSGELGLAFPLTRSVDTPLYGNNGKNPRLLMQVSKRF